MSWAATEQDPDDSRGDSLSLPSEHSAATRPVVVDLLADQGRPDGQNTLSPDEFQLLVEASLDMLCLLDETGSTVFVSPASRRLLGYEPGELVGRAWLALVHPDDRAAAHAAVGELLGGKPLRHAYRLRRKSDDLVWVESIGQQTRGARRFFVVVTRDISAQIEQQKLLNHVAMHDALTGLCNRRRAVDELTAAVARAERSGQPVAVLFIDLDSFKDVNDMYGHACGDEVLRSVAHRLVTSVRRGDTVARMGGDEFIVIAQNLPTQPEHAVAALADKLTIALAAEHRLHGVEVTVPGSIGTVVWEPGWDRERLLREADRLMYAAKRRA